MIEPEFGITRARRGFPRRDRPHLVVVPPADEAEAVDEQILLQQKAADLQAKIGDAIPSVWFEIVTNYGVPRVVAHIGGKAPDGSDEVQERVSALIKRKELDRTFRDGLVDLTPKNAGEAIMSGIGEGDEILEEVNGPSRHFVVSGGVSYVFSRAWALEGLYSAKTGERIQAVTTTTSPQRSPIATRLK